MRCIVRSLLATAFVIAILPALALGQLEKADGKLTVEYDKFTDQTTVRVLIRLKGEGFEGLAMMGVYQYKDAELKFIADLQEEMRKQGKRSFSSEWFKQITFGFVSISKERKYASGDGFIILADGRRWHGSLPAVEVTPKTKLTIEAFTTTISAEDLIKICRSTKVEVRLGREEFELTPQQLQPLRQLATNLILQSQGHAGLVTPTKD